MRALAKSISAAGKVEHTESYTKLLAAGAKPLRFAEDGSLLWPHMVYMPLKQKKFMCNRNQKHLEKGGLRGSGEAFETLEECQLFMAGCGLFPKGVWWERLQAWLLER